MAIDIEVGDVGVRSPDSKIGELPVLYWQNSYSTTSDLSVSPGPQATWVSIAFREGASPSLAKALRMRVVM